VNALPERFGPWLLVTRLAESLMAEVFVAVRLGDREGRTAVLKRPRLGERASGEAAQAIVREAEVLSRVRAPTLVGLEDRGEVAGLPFVAVEHVRGVSLDRLLARRGGLGRSAAFALGRDVLRALAALHDAGWVHADVAPSNVVVDEAGEAKLIDLGIALRAGEARQVLAGKPGYVAPEVPAHKPAAAAEDVYGAALVVAECIAGKRLFDERDVAEAATRADARAVIAKLDGGPALARALSPNAADRPSARALADELPDDPAARASIAAAVTSALAEPEASAPKERGAASFATTELAAPSAGRHTREVGAPGPAFPDVAASTERPLVEVSTTRAGGEKSTLRTPDGPFVDAGPGDGLPDTRVVAAKPAAPPPPVAVTLHAASDVERLRATIDPPKRPSVAVRVAIALGIAAVALGAGFAVGRRVGHPKGATLMLYGVTQRTEVVLDGRSVVLTDPNRPIPISAGKHTLSLSVRKREKDLEIDAVDGERYVFVPVLLPRAPGAEPSAERPR
jgi:serine/threonine-protein kinase